MSNRTEFGATRRGCSCRTCQMYCRFMPGFLIPADLARLIPKDADPLEWAETQLLASPGALVMKGFEQFRIPTLVPATKVDGSCIHLVGGKRNGRCSIWEKAPFGCAFFDCSPDPQAESLSSTGLVAIYNDWQEGGLYSRIWTHLDALGKRQLHADTLRERMRAVA